MKKSIKVSVLISQIIFFILIPVWLELTNYLHPLVIAVVWFCITSLVLLVVCWWNKEKIRLSKGILHALLLLYSLGLLILLFFRPNSQSYGSINIIPFKTIRLFLSGNVDFLIAFYNIGANIALFIPFGLYYKYINKKPSLSQIFILTICFIIIIEGLQFLTKRGSFDIDDLILNTLGVCLGYVIHPLCRKVLVIK